MNPMRISALAGLCLLAACTSSPKEEGPASDAKPLNVVYEQKRIALEPKFTHLDTFSVADGIAVASIDGKYGYVDTSGKELVPLTCYNVQPFMDGLGLVEESEGTHYFVDKTGKKVIDLAAYQNAYSFLDGYACVVKNDKFGLIDKTGKEVLPCKYDQGVFPISPGNYLLREGESNSIGNAQGQVTVPIKNFAGIYYDEVNNQYAYEDNSGWHIAGPDGKEKMKIGATGVIYNNGLYFLSKLSEKEGTVSAVMNGKGDLIVPFGKYGFINSTVSNGLVCVGNQTGETPLPDGTMQVNMKVGYIDATGKEVIPLQFEDVMFDFSEGLAVVEVKGKKGYIDPTGKLVIPAIFEVAHDFVNGYAKITQDGLESYIDKQGKGVL